MIKTLTPKFQFICDRCGREEYRESNIPEFEVAFADITSGFIKPIRAKGQVCYNCYKDFWEIAGNFFDEVNKE